MTDKKLAEFQDTDFLTIEEKKPKFTWPYEHTSTKGLWPYLKRTPGDLVGIEIGTSCAESTYLLLEKCPNIKKLYTIDAYSPFEDWNGTVTKEVLDRQMDVAKRNLEQFGDRVERLIMNSMDASKKFEPESVDFIFVDGDHTYDGVKKDCQTYYPFLKKGGFFCGHDYGFLPDVKKGVDDFRAESKITAPLNLSLNSAFFWYK